MRHLVPSLKNWQAFFCIGQNKVELFAFLATSTAATETEKQIISTYHKYVHGALYTHPEMFLVSPRVATRK